MGFREIMWFASVLLEIASESIATLADAPPLRRVRRLRDELDAAELELRVRREAAVRAAQGDAGELPS